MGASQRATEWLDIVDDRDSVLGCAPRSIVHAKGYMHRAAHIMLANTSGQVFVQLRSQNKDTNPGLWDTSAAGHVDSGESYLACAVRELDEELGVQLIAADMEYLQCLAPSVETGNEHVRIYRACADQALTLEADEVDDGRWMTPLELDDWIAATPAQLTTSLALIWRQIRGHFAV